MRTLCLAGVFQACRYSAALVFAGNPHGAMLRILSITLAVALLALPTAAIAQDSGLDAYTENPPTAGGDGDTTGTGTDGSPTGTSTATGTDSGVAGTSTSTGAPVDSDGDGVVSEDEAAAAGTTPAGQLPATGLDETLVMALIGGMLLAAGFALLRVSRRPV